MHRLFIHRCRLFLAQLFISFQDGHDKDLVLEKEDHLLRLANLAQWRFGAETRPGNTQLLCS